MAESRIGGTLRIADMPEHHVKEALALVDGIEADPALIAWAVAMMRARDAFMNTRSRR